jgi:hypothetical protein
VPYPNVGVDPTDTSFVPNVLMTCTPAHNMKTEPIMTNGDNAGVATGVASGTVMGRRAPDRRLHRAGGRRTGDPLDQRVLAKLDQLPGVAWSRVRSRSWFSSPSH